MVLLVVPFGRAAGLDSGVAAGVEELLLEVVEALAGVFGMFEVLPPITTTLVLAGMVFGSTLIGA